MTKQTVYYTFSKFFLTLTVLVQTITVGIFFDEYGIDRLRRSYIIANCDKLSYELFKNINLNLIYFDIKQAQHRKCFIASKAGRLSLIIES